MGQERIRNGLARFQTKRDSRSGHLTWLSRPHIAQRFNSLPMLRQVVTSQTKQLILRSSSLT